MQQNGLGANSGFQNLQNLHNLQNMYGQYGNKRMDNQTKKEE